MGYIYRSCALIVACLLLAVACGCGAWREVSHHEAIGAGILGMLAVLATIMTGIGVIATRDDYRQHLIEEARRG
jgi:hypothetical protein